VDISSGSIQTGGNAGVLVGIPYGNQVSENVAGGISTITGIQLPSKVVQPSLNDTWQQSWAVTPVSDSNALRRLRALYAYVTAPTDKLGRCEGAAPGDPIAAGHGSEAIGSPGDPATCSLLHDYDINPIVTNNLLVLDTSRILEPRCVICLRNDAVAQLRTEKLNDETKRFVDTVKLITRNFPKAEVNAVTSAVLQNYLNEYTQTSNGFSQIKFQYEYLHDERKFGVNPKLVDFRSALCWTNVFNTANFLNTENVGAAKHCPAGAGAVSKGIFGNHEIFLSRPINDATSPKTKPSLSDFVLFVIPGGDTRLPAPPSASSGNGTGGGKGP
jgi:hypothetical protein